MDKNSEQDQQRIRLLNPPLEEGKPISYNITINIFQVDGNMIVTDKSKREITKTIVQAKKMDKVAAGKGSKVLSFNLDGTKIILIIIAVAIAILLILALYAYISSNGQINAFPFLQELIKGIIPYSN